jgi:hypothetical protein
MVPNIQKIGTSTKYRIQIQISMVFVDIRFVFRTVLYVLFQ